MNRRKRRRRPASRLAGSRPCHWWRYEFRQRTFKTRRALNAWADEWGLYRVGTHEGSQVFAPTGCMKAKVHVTGDDDYGWLAYNPRHEPRW